MHTHTRWQDCPAAQYHRKVQGNRAKLACLASFYDGPPRSCVSRRPGFTLTGHSLHLGLESLRL